MKTYTQDELNKIVEEHKNYQILGGSHGARAIFRDADLRNLDFSNKDLSNAIFIDSDLTNANLSRAKFDLAYL